MTVKTKEVWEEFSEALRRFILNRVRNEDAAEDILQDAFLKIHRGIDKLRDARRLQAWLYQITRNTIIDYYRRQDALAESPEMPEEIPDELPAISDVAPDLGPCVKALMDRLPEKYRQSLAMTELEGRTQEEMGTELGLSFSGAKSRVQRARSRMRDLLLDCCRFEFDRRGNILDYQPQSQSSPNCCTDQTDCTGDQVDP
jgi:RNA polymerase sigma-70 factor, ECF subfamily